MAKTINKLISCLLIIIFCSYSFLPKVSAEDLDVNIDSGIIINNRIMVPLKIICEEIKASLSWDQVSKKATIVTAEANVVMKVGSNKYIKDGKLYDMEVAPVIIEGTIFIPVSGISKAFNLSVSLDQKERIVTINTKTHIIYLGYHQLFSLNGQFFVYEGDLQNGIPHGMGTGIKGISLYSGNVLHEGRWEFGKPVVSKTKSVDPENTNLQPSMADGMGMYNSFTYDGEEIKRGMSKNQVQQAIGKPNEIKTPLRGNAEAVKKLKEVYGDKYNFNDIEQWTYINKNGDNPSVLVIFLNHEGFVASLFAL